MNELDRSEFVREFFRDLRAFTGYAGRGNGAAFARSLNHNKTTVNEWERGQPPKMEMLSRGIQSLAQKHPGRIADEAALILYGMGSGPRPEWFRVGSGMTPPPAPPASEPGSGEGDEGERVFVLLERAVDESDPTVFQALTREALRVLPSHLPRRKKISFASHELRPVA